MKIIDKVALILLAQRQDNQLSPPGQLLVARSEGKKLFYIPGGKRELDESDHQSLRREVEEELDVSILNNTIQYANTFEAPADGKKDTLVRTACYYAEVDRKPQASREIEQLMWVSLEDKKECSLVTQMIMDWLHAQGKIHCREVQPPIAIGTVKDYDWIVFDADNTLFRFQDFSGLQLMFEKKWEIDFTKDDYDEYKKLNLQLWKHYEGGTITSEKLANDRFQKWAKTLNTTPQNLNQQFLEAMAEVCTPLPGAVDLIKALHRKVKLAIITNGFTSLQNIRLEKNDLLPCFAFVLSSEAAGVAKPHKEIFEKALNKMGNPKPTKVLMVGDNPASDIKGAKSIGLTTCLLDESNGAPHQDPACHADHTVSSLPQLLATLQGTRAMWTRGKKHRQQEACA